MIYLQISQRFIDLQKLGVYTLLVELTDQGEPLREIGLGVDKEVVHAYPSVHHKYGAYGLLDLASFDTTNLESNLEESVFLEMWNGLSQS